MNRPASLERSQSNLLRELATLTLFVAIPLVQAHAQKESTSSLQGAWSVTKIDTGEATTAEPAQPGLFIFGRKHYSAVYTLGSEPRPVSETAFSPTPEEMAKQYQTLIVNAGTYKVEGSTITMNPVVAKSPEFIGGTATIKFQIDGDVLSLVVSSIAAADGSMAPIASGRSITLRRVE